MFDVPVLVVGDVMLDRHVHGHVRRISPEAPIPVVSLVGENNAPGGAGNVAATLAGLGCRVTLAGLAGDDAEGAQLREALAPRESSSYPYFNGSTCRRSRRPVSSLTASSSSCG